MLKHQNKAEQAAGGSSLLHGPGSVLKRASIPSAELTAKDLEATCCALVN